MQEFERYKLFYEFQMEMDAAWMEFCDGLDAAMKYVEGTMFLCVDPAEFEWLDRTEWQIQ